MNRKEFKKQVYCKPAIGIIVLQQESLLQTGSGQHNPGNKKPGPSSAKQGWFDEESEQDWLEDEENTQDSWNF